MAAWSVAASIPAFPVFATPLGYLSHRFPDESQARGYRV